MFNYILNRIICHLIKNDAKSVLLNNSMICKKHQIKKCPICLIHKITISEDGYPSDGQGTTDFSEDQQIELLKELQKRILNNEVKVVSKNFKEWKDELLPKEKETVLKKVENNQIGKTAPSSNLLKILIIALIIGFLYFVGFYLIWTNLSK